MLTRRSHPVKKRPDDLRSSKFLLKLCARKNTFTDGLDAQLDKPKVGTYHEAARL